MTYPVDPEICSVCRCEDCVCIEPVDRESPKYSEEEITEMRQFERTMWLRDIEAGKVLTEKQYEGIRHFLGELIDAAKALPMRSVSIHFDKNGEAHSIDNDGFIESVNGKKL